MRYRVLFVGLLFFRCSYAQDTVRQKHTVKELAKDLYHSVLVTGKKTNDSIFFQKSERAFQPYAGKVIRKTIVRKLAFGENVQDTSQALISALSRVANNLQTGTKPFIIKQFLFVKEGELLDPYRLADNERLLRSLDFVKDSRIRVFPVPKSSDSVDIYMIVRDVFSLGAKGDASGFSDFSGTLYDANFLGRAQRVEYSLLLDKNRHPKFGSDIFYRKYNIWGSFINADLSYTTINKGISLGNENETSVFLKLERPLYTPSAKFAGGINLSWNHSVNRYRKMDSLFLDYQYTLQDYWVGYNIGTHSVKPSHGYREDSRKRKFAAIRYYEQYFFKKPHPVGYDYLYTNKRFVIGELNWYKLDFYKTNYIYGFGVTEDVPIGFSRKIIAGYSKIDSLRRMYIGWQYDHWLVDHNENFFNYTIALGGNYYKKTLQDNSLLFNFSWFSRLFSFKKFRFRQYADISYAGIGNYRVYDVLHINNEFGLLRFNTDSVTGIQRLTVGMESDFFTKWRFFGFRIGVFTFAKSTLLGGQHGGLLAGNLYSALGGGFRMRNENLIFGTIEGRFTWFPRTIENINNVTLRISGNIRFKFPDSFVKAPWFALLK